MAQNFGLPTYENIVKKVEEIGERTLTALERFIYANEPAGDDEEAFREGLREVLYECMGDSAAIAAAAGFVHPDQEGKEKNSTTGIDAGYKRHRYAQGTIQCIAFNQGARWWNEHCKAQAEAGANNSATFDNLLWLLEHNRAVVKIGPSFATVNHRTKLAEHVAYAVKHYAKDV